MKYKKTIKEIEKFLQERSQGLEGGVIGLSGGIDSSRSLPLNKSIRKRKSLWLNTPLWQTKHRGW